MFITSIIAGLLFIASIYRLYQLLQLIVENKVYLQNEDFKQIRLDLIEKVSRLSIYAFLSLVLSIFAYTLS